MQMDEKMIPYIVHESEVARLERVIKRLWILCIIIFLSLIATNAGWIYYESQWEDMTISQDVDTGTGDAVVTGTGDINYAKDKTNDQNP